MICPNCKVQVVDEANFCPNCKYNLLEMKNNNYSHINVDSKNKSKKSKFIYLFFIVLIIIGLGYFGIFFFNENKKYNNNDNANEYVEEQKKENETKEVVIENKKNSLEKIKADYESGNLSINDYFTQMVYLEFDSSKLDKKYISDYEYYYSGCEFNTSDILENNYDNLDEDVVKFYLINKTLSNVVFDDGSSIKKQSDNNIGYEVKKIENELDKNIVSSHILNNVRLSSNGHFLIWYTDTGDDAITEEQVLSIANGLENSITKYEKLFGIKYSFTPYIDDRKLDNEWLTAKMLLDKNNISIDKLKTALSVYVFDMGSGSTLAEHRSEPLVLAKILNKFLDITSKDGVINYPYIVLNKVGFSENENNFVQIYNHELFHHFQLTFCKSVTGKRCITDGRLYESMANFASSLVSDSTNSSAYLNRWAGVYTSHINSKLSDLNDGRPEAVGYPIFPYFYSYFKNKNNWAEVLMNAHNVSDSFNYIYDNTSQLDLMNTINDVAYYSLSQKYDNQALISNKGIQIKAELEYSKSNTMIINAGAIDYFEIKPNTKIIASTNNNSFLTINIYGLKNGNYEELLSSFDNLEFSTKLYKDYDTFYLAVTNANLIESYDYSIELEDINYVENSEYATVYDNYNIEIEMNTRIKGIDVIQQSKGIVDELHQKEYLDINSITMGMNLSSKAYYDFNSGYSYSTQPFGGDVWYREKYLSQIVDLGTIVDKLLNMNGVTKIADNHYKVKMTNDDIKGLIDSSDSNTSIINDDIIVDVYTADGYIVKLEYDFSNLVSSFELFKVTIKYSNYNNAGDVNIPQSIVDNAKDL